MGQLVVLFLLHVFLAKIFGASPELDVYLAVLAIPLLLSSVLSGSLGSVIIPLSHKLKASQGEAAMMLFLNRLGWCLLAVSSGLACLLFLAAGAVMRWLYADFSGPQLQLGIELLRIVGWLIPLNTMTSFLFSVFHTQGRFLRPAASGLIGPAITVAMVAGIPHAGIHHLAWAILMGGIAGVIMLLPGFPRAKTKTIVPLKPVYRQFGLLLAPLVFGAAFFRLDPIVDRHLAVSAALSEGSISHLNYASRLITSVTLAATGGLAVVVFPAMARHRAAGEEEQYVSELAHAWRFLCVVLIPMIGGILCYSRTLVAWLLERGAFSPADTQVVAGLMCLYASLILTAGIGEVATQAFYSQGDTRTPTLLAILGFCAGVLMKFLLVAKFKVQGLALITSATSLLNATMMLIGLRLKVQGALFADLGKTLARTIFCSTLALGSVWFLLAEAHGWRVPTGIAGAILCYIGLQWLFRDEFIVRILRGFLRF